MKAGRSGEEIVEDSPGVGEYDEDDDRFEEGDETGDQYSTVGSGEEGQYECGILDAAGLGDTDWVRQKCPDRGCHGFLSRVA
jgi:hypothetical protein